MGGTGVQGSAVLPPEVDYVNMPPDGSLPLVAARLHAGMDYVNMPSTLQCVLPQVSPQDHDYVNMPRDIPSAVPAAATPLPAESTRDFSVTNPFSPTNPFASSDA